MFRRTILSLFLILLSGAPAFCQQSPYILHATDPFDLMRVIWQYGLVFDHAISMAQDTVVVDVPNSTPAAIAQVAADPSVVFFEPDQVAQTPEPTVAPGQLDPLPAGSHRQPFQGVAQMFAEIESQPFQFEPAGLDFR